jgi:hypothetical protein
MHDSHDKNNGDNDRRDKHLDYPGPAGQVLEDTL